jgi:NAD(P)-dependent dehydrogenase (short-subunit alcohol dehydrogenase family)
VAGAGQFLATEHASEADLEWIHDVNFKGVVRTTRAALPNMRKARSGQVINVTSVGGLVGIPFNDLYCGTKFAIEGFTEALATYMTPAFGIKFTCVEPGGIESDFIGTAMAQALASMPDDEYRAMFEEMFRGADSPEARAAFQTAAECAAVVVDLVGNLTPPLRIRTGAWAEGFTHFKTAADPDGTKQVQQLAQMFTRR